MKPVRGYEKSNIRVGWNTEKASLDFARISCRTCWRWRTSHAAFLNESRCPRPELLGVKFLPLSQLCRMAQFKAGSRLTRFGARCIPFQQLRRPFLRKSRNGLIIDQDGWRITSYTELERSYTAEPVRYNGFTCCFLCRVPFPSPRLFNCLKSGSSKQIHGYFRNLGFPGCK